MSALTERAATPNERLRAQFAALAAYLDERIIGQPALTSRLLIALLCDGHILVEGAPGLAKTTAIKTLAGGIEGDFHRIQFTPDLLPADLTGTDVFRPQSSDFEFQPGPIFHSLLLADEVNRAPAKVQSALLEAMAERQVTVGAKSYPLPALFLVMATQNPIEQEGTYPLPEAQLDRFLLQVKVGYPDRAAEQRIMALVREEAHAGGTAMPNAAPIVSATSVLAARDAVLELFLAEELERYIVELVAVSREGTSAGAGQLADRPGRWLRYGASPRASLALDRAARAHAWLAGRDYVTPDDIQAMAHEVLRHRLVPAYAADAQEISADDVIRELLRYVAVP